MSKITTERHYKITLSNGSTYYGRTTIGNQRYRNHKSDVRVNKHDNPKVQESYNKYGYDGWVHEWLSTETGDKQHHDKIEYGYVQADPKALNINDGRVALLSEDEKRLLNNKRSVEYRTRRNNNWTPEDRAAWNKDQRERQKRWKNNMSPKEKEEHNRKQRVKDQKQRDSMTREEKDEYNRKQTARRHKRQNRNNDD